MFRERVTWEEVGAIGGAISSQFSFSSLDEMNSAFNQRGINARFVPVDRRQMEQAEVLSRDDRLLPSLNDAISRVVNGDIIVERKKKRAKIPAKENRRLQKIYHSLAESTVYQLLLYGISFHMQVEDEGNPGVLIPFCPVEKTFILITGLIDGVQKFALLNITTTISSMVWDPKVIFWPHPRWCPGIDGSLRSPMITLLPRAAHLRSIYLDSMLASSIRASPPFIYKMTNARVEAIQQQALVAASTDMRYPEAIHSALSGIKDQSIQDINEHRIETNFSMGTKLIAPDAISRYAAQHDEVTGRIKQWHNNNYSIPFGWELASAPIPADINDHIIQLDQRLEQSAAIVLAGKDVLFSNGTMRQQRSSMDDLSARSQQNHINSIRMLVTQILTESHRYCEHQRVADAYFQRLRELLPLRKFKKKISSENHPRLTFEEAIRVGDEIESEFISITIDKHMDNEEDKLPDVAIK